MYCNKITDRAMFSNNQRESDKEFFLSTHTMITKLSNIWNHKSISDNNQNQFLIYLRSNFKYLLVNQSHFFSGVKMSVSLSVLLSISDEVRMSITNCLNHWYILLDVSQHYDSYIIIIIIIIYYYYNWQASQINYYGLATQTQ